MSLPAPVPGAACGLGFDAGGTQTRWALADAAGRILAEGAAQGFSALQMESAEGRAVIEGALRQVAAQLPAQRPVRVFGGMTGYGGDSPGLRALAAAAFSLPEAAIHLSNDLYIAYRAMFAPGEGYLVYAGTGSIAAYIDADHAFHRAGGRGVLLDDAGGGAWIACQALRHIWRLEDEAPGSWEASPMARAIFERIDGSDWSHTRSYVYGKERGALGLLALPVARAADQDPVAQDILRRAGEELARLAMALTGRFGARPVALSGRVAQLHPLIESAFRAALPEGTGITVKASQAHHAAARLALTAGEAEVDK